ncbi:NAD(P)-binding domain-containing protein [Desmospora profundinema]|uniref:Thioredoxin reductase n=1 Tax=Desmospora profundinema TaxID=1571184 RepID=A0ABU1IME8_9BACL|nr:NAD(P)-binding domain-containing protein [Desmospora profundinema]MDR6225134.1 thioredoxin reductase [Desmospora profundinema]
MHTQHLPVAVIGGGPVGLAAAAHLVRKRKPFVLFEKGVSVGASVLEWGHVRMFSPWEFNIDQAAEELLLQHDWISPPKDELPTGEELVNLYLFPLSRLPMIQPFVLTNSKVVAVNRKGLDKVKTAGRDQVPFEITYETNGVYQKLEASAVIDASGTWYTPNPVGANGNLAMGEKEFANRIFYGIPDVSGKQRNRYAEKAVAVVGSGHSAIHTLLNLEVLKRDFKNTTIHWVLRKQAVSDTYGGEEKDALPARGALGKHIRQLVEEERIQVHAGFRIESIRQSESTLTLSGNTNGQLTYLDHIDEIVVNTGARPDFSFLRELRYESNTSIESVPDLAELIDPNIHSCGTVRPHGEAELRQPEKDFYIVGSKSYGRAPTFLMATGYEQVRSIVAALCGDWEAAKKVELNLPETGVCGTQTDKGSTCCGPANVEKENTSSCC